MKIRTLITAIAAVIGGALALWRFGTSPFGIMSGLNVAVIISIAGFVIGKLVPELVDVHGILPSFREDFTM